MTHEEFFKGLSSETLQKIHLEMRMEHVELQTRMQEIDAYSKIVVDELYERESKSYKEEHVKDGTLATIAIAEIHGEMEKQEMLDRIKVGKTRPITRGL